MVDDIAIRAEHLSKRFRVHTEKRSALKERVVRGRAPRAHDYWALKDASFEIKRGETFGIIGHNGSGKSTALKVLTGVYRPTSGSVTVNGRISALLELGAGFHPELTGRENVRLNGAILGMSRRQIDGVMDEIIDFSGIEEFIDSPVKVYSSGMFVRLGFAIAVKLDPRILIVDEIIAVGDEQFQRKCYEYLYRLRRDGCTIVIVSHAMGVIEDLCDQAVWLSHGEVQALGPARQTVEQYMDRVDAEEIQARAVAARDAGSPVAEASAAGRGTGEIRVTALEFLDKSGEATTVLLSREPATIRFHYRANAPMTNVQFGFAFHDESGAWISGRNSMHSPVGTIQAGDGHVDCLIPDLQLTGGSYRVTTMLSESANIFDERKKAFTVTVRSNDRSASGYVVFPVEWGTATRQVADKPTAAT